MRHYNKLWVFFLIYLSIYLSGCAVQQAHLDGVALEDIKHWEAKGKISITLPATANNSRQRKTANFTWQNQGGDFDIRLSGPLGAGTAKLEKRGERVSLSDGKQVLRATTPEQLLFETTGWKLPISELAWWIKGLPAPEASQLTSENARYNQAGELSTLLQHGWQLEYQAYTHVSGKPLPRKIVAHRDGLRLIIIVKQWALAPNAG